MFGEFEKVEHANVKTLRFENGMVRDDKNMFYRGEKLDADQKTFALKSGLYAIDNTNVYCFAAYPDYRFKKLEGVDPATFSFIGDSASIYLYKRSKRSLLLWEKIRELGSFNISNFRIWIC